MQFTGRVLVKCKNSQARTCWLDQAGPELEFNVGESEKLNSVAEKAIRDYIEAQAVEYINLFSHGDDWVNCQEGRTKVPADVWHCKITEKVCPIQAHINLNDKEAFFQGCNLDNHEQKVRECYDKSPEEYKKGLWGAINKGEYRGHHHDPGSMPCFSCDRSTHREEYHFPWELTRLSDHIDDYKSARTSEELIFSDIAYNLSNPICARCITSLEESHPEICFQSYGLELSDYFSVKYSYRPNS